MKKSRKTKKRRGDAHKNCTRHTFFGAILPIDAYLLPLSLSPPPPPFNTATAITSILPRDMFSLKTLIVSSATMWTKTRNSTHRVLPSRLQFENPEWAPLTSLFSVDSSRVLEHEFESSRSKTDASQLAFNDPEWAPLTSLFSVDSLLALDLKLEKRAKAFPFVEVPNTVGESTKVKIERSESYALQLASDDLEWAPITSLFSVDSPLTLDPKVRASIAKLVDGFSSRHLKKVDSKYSSVATRVRRPRTGTINQSLQCRFASNSGSQTRSAQEQNFEEDFLSVGKETTPSVLPVPIAYQYMKKI